MKNTNAKEVTKDITAAMAEFTSNVTKNAFEAQAKVWEEMVKFGETVNKTTTEIYKDHPIYKAVTGLWTK